MKVEISVPEIVEIFNEIQQQPERLFEMIRFNIQETVGQYLTALMNAELTHFLGRGPNVAVANPIIAMVPTVVILH